MSIPQLFTECAAMQLVKGLQRGPTSYLNTCTDPNSLKVLQRSDGAGGLIDSNIVDVDGAVLIGADTIEVLPFLGGSPTFVVSSGLIGTYGQRATVGMGVPALYGNILNVQSLTSANPAFSLFAAAPVGTYRISGYLVVTVAGTSGTISVNAVITDETGARSLEIARSADISTLVALPFSAVIRNAAGQNIQVSSSFNTVVTGGLRYSFYAQAEQLVKE